VVGEGGVGGVDLAAPALVFRVLAFRHYYYKRKISTGNN
jgi:hypothetical protein